MVYYDGSTTIYIMIWWWWKMNDYNEHDEDARRSYTIAQTRSQALPLKLWVGSNHKRGVIKAHGEEVGACDDCNAWK